MPAAKIEVKFLQDTIYETNGPKKGPMFRKDHTYEFPENFAQKWIIKGVAVRVEPKPALETAALRKAPEPGDVKSEPTKDEPKSAVTPVTKNPPDPSKILGHKDLGLTPPPAKPKTT